MTLAADVNDAIAEAQRTLSAKFPNTAVRMLVTGTLIAAALWFTAGLLCVAVLGLSLALGISSLCLAGAGTVLLLAACTAGAWAGMLAWASACAYVTVTVFTWTCSQASGLHSSLWAAAPSATPDITGSSRIPKAPSTSQCYDAGIGSGHGHRHATAAAKGEAAAGVTDSVAGGGGCDLGVARPPAKAALHGSSRKCMEAGQLAQSSWGQDEQLPKGSRRAESASSGDRSDRDSPGGGSGRHSPGEGASTPGVVDEAAVPAGGDASAAVVLARARKQLVPLHQQSSPAGVAGGKVQGVADA